MEKYNKLLRNITELIEKGLFTSKNLKKEVKDSLKFEMEIIANKLNLVSREEFEIHKKLVEKLQKDLIKLKTSKIKKKLQRQRNFNSKSISRTFCQRDISTMCANNIISN